MTASKNRSLVRGNDRCPESDQTPGRGKMALAALALGSVLSTTGVTAAATGHVDEHCCTDRANGGGAAEEAGNIGPVSSGEIVGQLWRVAMSGSGSHSNGGVGGNGGTAGVGAGIGGNGGVGAGNGGPGGNGHGGHGGHGGNVGSGGNGGTGGVGAGNGGAGGNGGSAGAGGNGGTGGVGAAASGGGNGGVVWGAATAVTVALGPATGAANTLADA